MSRAERNGLRKDVCERRVIEAARRQRGVVSRSQLIAAGLSPSAISRRVSNGTLDQVLPTVYSLTAAGSTWEQRAVAALLWASADAAVSHISAARIWKLLVSQSARVEVLVARKVKSPVAWLKVHEVDAIPRRDKRIREGICVTSPERTLLDLGSRISRDELEEAIEASIREGLTTFARLQCFLLEAARPGRRGTRKLRELLVERGDVPPTGSALETRLERLVLGVGLPRAERQYSVYDGDRFVGRVDFAWPHAKVALEVDSWRYHGCRRAWSSDSRRTEELRNLGWVVLRFTYEDLRDRSEWVLASIERELRGQLFKLSEMRPAERD